MATLDGTRQGLRHKTSVIPRAYLVAGVLTLLAPLALFFDLPLARIDARQLPGDIYKGIMVAEVFGHGIGIAMILLVVWVLDNNHRARVLWLALCAYVPGLVVHAAKQLVARTRPNTFSFEGPVWDTFVGAGPTWIDHSIQSFPSAHTASGAGFAIGLAFFYPHGRCMFFSFGVLVGIQRIAVDAHFLSDTLVGGALGIAVAAWLLSRGPAKHSSPSPLSRSG